MSDAREFHFTDTDVSIRLDAFLVDQLNQDLSPESVPYSRSFVAKLIKTGKVTLNGNVQHKVSKILQPEDSLSVDLAQADTAVAAEIPIIFECDDYVIINKPAGVLSQPRRDHDNEATVADIVGSADAERSGIVHRLDRETSGVMVVSKNNSFSAHIADQFAGRTVKKHYVAISANDSKSARKIDVQTGIERNPSKPYTFRASANGKPSRTLIETTIASPYIRIDAFPHTGRTHQIRVHCAHVGLQILGDQLYDGDDYDRLMLHSYEISFQNREGELVEYAAPLPDEFQELLHS